jgi:hypothetical protein
LKTLSCTAAVTIDGGGSGVTLDTNYHGRIFSFYGGGTQVSLTHLTLTNGQFSFGGGIFNAGAL